MPRLEGCGMKNVPILPSNKKAICVRCGKAVMKRGVHTVWTDGSGKHSSNPHFRRCGVGYVTYTGERAELLARRIVSDCKGVAKALQAIQSGQRQPKERS
eukprot:3655424-Amphidinium_carterae.1